ncbi:MAG: MBL fold metallo-hydrolase, partial [Hyphomonadaceae bacterium]
GPNVNARGVAGGDGEDMELALEELEDAAEAAFTKLGHHERGDDDAIEAAVQRAVRKAAERLWTKRPLVDVSILRI